MKRKHILLFVFILSLLSNKILAQKKQITLEDIWGGVFSVERMNSLKSMNGDFYSVLNYDKSTNTSLVEKYSYKTQKKVATIFSTKNNKELPYIGSYSFNNNETKLLLGTNFKKIYRYSRKGSYFVYDLKKELLYKVGDDIFEPTFSPDGEKIAYVKNNNLFVKDLKNKTIIKVTNDGKVNSIINGTTDWVYEEEFAFVRAFEWGKNSDYLAFLRFDESEVPTFYIDFYGKKLYSTQYKYKYPKAGEKNSKVSLHIFNLKYKNVSKVNLGSYEYIPRIKWTNDKNLLSVITLNRHQNDLKLFFVDVKSNKSKVILNETDSAYIDINDSLTFLDDNSFIWTSDKDGFNHIYHYSNKGVLKKQITKGNWDVTNYYGLNKFNKKIYYQSVENGSINRGVYSINIDGTDKKLLTPKNGQNYATFSKNLNYFINNYSTIHIAPTYNLYDANGNKIKELKNNLALQLKLSNYQTSTKEFFNFKINNTSLNMLMIKPANFDSNKKYPLLMYQYSGPGSQQVANRWNNNNDYWFQMLAQKGIIVVCVDGRGTGYKGRDFKKITQKQLGKYEVEDQIKVAKELVKLPYIDKNNVGIWGWSYGGFMSANCILKGNDVFTLAIAVAPVTSWGFYDTIYTERYMTTPQENPSGYNDNSPINYPELLKGKFLLIHGSGDDNVHVENTYRFAEALIQANKEFQWSIYPDKNHGIYGGKTRIHLYNKMTNFIYKNFGIK